MNLRSLMSIKKGHNSKGLALFMRGYSQLYITGKNKEYLLECYKIADLLLSLRSTGRTYHCWGYNFDWESIAYFVPANEPNMVVSSFVAQAFLDLYCIDNNPKWLAIGVGVAKFIYKELLLHNDNDEICFGYIPEQSHRVHNANLMGSLLFARLHKLTGRQLYKDVAKKSVCYTVNRQMQNGAWVYGEAKHWQWVDNFHTGYNLIAIAKYQKFCNDYSFENALKKSYQYHIKNHFDEFMTPKYYDTKKFPIDIHNFAQGILTFIEFNDLKKAKMIYNNSIKMMFNDSEAYFFYQKTKLFTNRINYIRWSQAWMFFAIAKLYSKLIMFDKFNDNDFIKNNKKGYYI